MRILVTGVSSSPGYKIALALARDHEVIGIYKDNPVDLRGGETVRWDLLKDPEGPVGSYRPDLLVHVASIGDVDLCEEERDLCYRFNVEASRRLIVRAHRIGARIFYISTDYVFDGSRGLYSEDDIPRPINFYGLTKLLAEEAVRSLGGLIVRVSSVYGSGPGRRSFWKYVIEGLKRGEKVYAAVDLWTSPTLNDYIGEAIAKLARMDFEGVLHVAGPRLSRYEFAVALAKAFDLNKSLITPVSVRNLSFKAPRPIDSSLRSDKASKMLGINLSDLGKALEILRRGM